MKTIRFLILTIMFGVGISLNALQATPTPSSIKVSNDTIIIKFGKSSHIELHIADKADRKVLSELDLNELVEKINAYMESKNEQQDTLPLYSEADGNVVSAKIQSIENATSPLKSESTELIKDPQEITPCAESKTKLTWMVDVGLGNYVQKGKSKDKSAQRLRKWRSMYWAISANLKQKITSKIDLRAGLESSLTSLSFAQNTALEVSEQGTRFEIDSFNVNKSKLNITYLTLPLMLEFKHLKRWSFGVGGHIGYKIGSNTKKHYRVEGVNKTEKKYGNFGMNHLKYGLRSEMSYDGVRLFMNYDLNSLFKGESSDLQLFSFGVRI